MVEWSTNAPQGKTDIAIPYLGPKVPACPICRTTEKLDEVSKMQTSREEEGEEITYRCPACGLQLAIFFYDSNKRLPDWQPMQGVTRGQILARILAQSVRLSKRGEEVLAKSRAFFTADDEKVYASEIQDYWNDFVSLFRRFYRGLKPLPTWVEDLRRRDLQGAREEYRKHPDLRERISLAEEALMDAVKPSWMEIRAFRMFRKD
ncbi:MAG TPA: hypothetical protein GXZ96_03900 [Firmicutes bacterium]|jgi:hypothetical protein|nr:hypothetical protein [Bacillota bacterium]